MSALKSVYVIQSAGGPVKIGIASDPAKRLRDLQDGQPFIITLARVFTPANANAQVIERAAHSLLREKRARGEWFNVSIEEAVAAIEKAVEMVESGWTYTRSTRLYAERVQEPLPVPQKTRHIGCMTLGKWMLRNNYSDRKLAAALGLGPTNVARMRLCKITPNLLTALKINAFTEGEVTLHEMVPKHLLPPDMLQTPAEPTASESPAIA